MPVEMHREATLLRIVARDAISLEEVFDEIARLEEEEDLRAGLDRLVVLEPSARLSTMSLPALERIRQRFESLEDAHGNNMAYSLAFVAPVQEHRGIAQLYGALVTANGHVDVVVELFDTEDEARMWLGARQRQGKAV